MSETKRATIRFVVCLRNDGYPASLEPRKIYQVVPDADAAGLDQIRVIDESGDDYLYPQDYFAPIELSRAAEEALLLAAR